MAELREVSLVDRIEAAPVVATGRRWLCGREDHPEHVESYFTMYPECRTIRSAPPMARSLTPCRRSPAAAA